MTNYAHNDSEESETTTISDSSNSSGSSDSLRELNPLQRDTAANGPIVRAISNGESEQDDRSRQGQITIVDTVPVTNHTSRSRTHPPRTEFFRFTRSLVHRLTRALRARASGFQLPRPRLPRGPIPAIPLKLHTESSLSRRLREEHRIFMDEVRRRIAQVIIENNNRNIKRLPAITMPTGETIDSNEFTTYNN